MGKTGIDGNTERRKGAVLLDAFTGVPNPEFGFFWLTPPGAELALFPDSCRNCHCLEESAELHPWLRG